MEYKSYLKLNDIDAYKVAFHLSNYLWNIIITWGNFEKETVGRQFVRAADSISANIAEGFGRHFKKDKIKFYRYAKGSIKEALDWNEKAKVRNLIRQEEYDKIFNELDQLPKLVNQLIKYTDKMLNE